EELRAAGAEEILRLPIPDAEGFHALAECLDIGDEPSRVAAGRGIFRAGAGLVILLRRDEVKLHFVVGIAEPGAPADIVERLGPFQELEPEYPGIEFDAGIEILMAYRDAFMHRAEPSQCRGLRLRGCIHSRAPRSCFHPGANGSR